MKNNLDVEMLPKNLESVTKKSFTDVVESQNAKERVNKGVYEEEISVPIKLLSNPKMVRGMWWWMRKSIAKGWNN